MIASGVGAILPFFYKEYGHDPKINDLVTYPSLFIGLGNLITVPLSHAVGRRPVFLLSTFVFVLASVWAGLSTSLRSHIAARAIISLAAGSAEALCPIIVQVSGTLSPASGHVNNTYSRQECHFLHERANRIGWFCGLQTLGTSVLIMASSYLAGDTSWRWWYFVFAIVNAGVFVMAIFLIPETMFVRTEEARPGMATASNDHEDDVALRRVTTRTRQAIDHDNYPPLTLPYILKPWHGHAHWIKAITCWRQMAQVVLFPNVFWLMLTSGAFLGIYVVASGLFANILTAPPHNWSFDLLGFVFGGQAFITLIIVPLSGYGSDMIVKALSRRNEGFTEPEYRLLPLILPFIVGIVSTVIYGKAAGHPFEWNWSAIVVSMNTVFYGFIAVVIGSFTYCIDAYPDRSDACLVVLCAARGIIAFGLSYAAADLAAKGTFEKAMNICAIVLGCLAAFGFPIYFFGKSIRRMTQKWAVGNR